MKKIIPVIFLFACITITTNSFAQVTAQDSLALVDLYNNTNGPGWTNHTNWLTASPVNTWYGVTLLNSNVTELHLRENNLAGSLASSIGNLPFLQIFDLEGNGLTGNIPSTIGNDTSLCLTDFQYNNFSGGIPSSFGNLKKLGSGVPNSGIFGRGYVDLSYNQLSDNIPPSIGQLSNLEYFWLNNNKLSGNIPLSFTNLTSITELDLSQNQLDGDSIPAILPHYYELYNVSGNRFTFSAIEQFVKVDTGTQYAPQARIPIHYNAGTLSASAGGTLSNNTYKWYEGSTLVATNVADSTFVPSSKGIYSAAVTNAAVTQSKVPIRDLILYSDTVNLLSDSLILPAHPRIGYANREFTGTDGWTNYYFDNNTPNDYTDDTLLLSLNKNGQNIGTIGDGTFAVKLAATAQAGSNTSIELTNPLITNPSGFWVMNRYWLVTPTAEPTSNVGVRFYYNNQDLADVNGSYPSHDLTNLQLIFYKTIGGNSDPTTNLAGATAIISILNSTYASDTTWTYHQLTDTTQYAEFSVAGFSGGGGGGTGNDKALPIKLLSFTAAKNGGKNLLQWATTQEINSNYFSVERSNDDVSFTSLGIINAKGNLIATSAYSFTDNKPNNGKNYYRLRMVNKDGSFTYSEIKSINDAISFAVNIYPNPVKTNLTLNFSSDNATNAQIEIVNNEGEILLSKQISIAEGTSTQNINTASLVSGIYYIRCVTADGESETKFVKE